MRGRIAMPGTDQPGGVCIYGGVLGAHANSHEWRAGMDDTDTIVVPAREDGFQAVFLGENRWYAIQINAAWMERIKYVTVYRVAPISAITHIAPVKSFEVWEKFEALKKVEPWRRGTKYVVNFAGHARKIGPISLVRGGRVKAPQGIRYTSRRKLLRAKTLDELWS
jgi:hypothetical protein